MELRGYRGLHCDVEINSPLSILAGANNAGKSTLIDAIRTVTHGYTDARAGAPVRPSDFPHSDDGTLVADTFDITLRYKNLDVSELGRMVTCLSPRHGVDTAAITLTAQLSTQGKASVRITGGDFSNPDVEGFAKSAVRHVYLPPLRDAARDLRSGHSGKLRDLVSVFSDPDGQDEAKLEAIINAANEQLRNVPSIKSAASALANRLSALTGDGAFRQTSDLQFAEARYSRAISTLRALMGKETPLDIDENGLGYNNILYMAVLMAVLNESKDDPLHILLVEEPEAHLHPQLQDLLMQYLESEANGNVQVILTTHSPQLASGARVEHVTVMAVDEVGARGSFALKNAPLSTLQLDYLRRFLDVTKSSMLFAKGVLLVEGIAELLVIPEIARNLGLPLSEMGVSIVNVEGLGFANFTPLFKEGGLPSLCSVVTDADRKLGDEETAEDDDSSDQIEDAGISATATKLLSEAGSGIEVFLATRTFEWDLAYTGNNANREILLKALEPLRPRKTSELRMSKTGGEKWANEFLEAVKNYKGRFAQSLAQVLSRGEHDFVIPTYLEDAIHWACSVPSLGSDPRPDYMGIEES